MIVTLHKKFPPISAVLASPQNSTEHSFQSINRHRCSSYSQLSVIFHEVFSNNYIGPDVYVPLLEADEYKAIGSLTPNSTYNFYIFVSNDDIQDAYSQTAQVMLTQGIKGYSIHHFDVP